MYTCNQNARNSFCGNRCGGCCQNTCLQNVTQQNTTQQTNCLQNRCGWGMGWNIGCLTNCNTANGNGNTTNVNGSVCSRYITFPVSGTAYVPTSAIYFCANSVGATGTNNGSTTNGGCSGVNGGCGVNCCGFGRCGGLRAYSNYNDAYYARQYGLDNDD